MAIGLGLAFLISRSIKRPIVALTGAMNALAKGDRTVAIPNTADNNEIGEMAQSRARVSGCRRSRMRGPRAGGRRSTAHRCEPVSANATNRRSATRSNRSGPARRRLYRRRRLAKLADKDLTYRFSADLPGAYRQLQSDFNAAIGQLEQAMKSVDRQHQRDPFRHGGNLDAPPTTCRGAPSSRRRASKRPRRRSTRSPRR